MKIPLSEKLLILKFGQREKILSKKAVKAITKRLKQLHK